MVAIHFRFKHKHEGVLWLTKDDPEDSENKNFDDSYIKMLEELIDEINLANDVTQKSKIIERYASKFTLVPIIWQFKTR